MEEIFETIVWPDGVDGFMQGFAKICGQNGNPCDSNDVTAMLDGAEQMRTHQNDFIKAFGDGKELDAEFAGNLISAFSQIARKRASLNEK